MVSVSERVLAAVRGQSSAIAKADIVRLTELSLATVSEHVDLLCESGLLREEKLGASSGGRRPKLYGFNPEAGYIVAIDLESNHVRVALTDFGLRIIRSDESYEIDVAEGPEATLGKISTIVLSLLEAAGVKRQAIKALGIGLPGPVSFSDGLPSSLSIMPGWENYPVNRFWRQHFDCPSFIDNNVYTMALGERAGGGDARETMIFVKIGNGIGAGIVCDGEVFRGATEHAGEIGHTDTGHGGLCYCGNRGCLDAYAGGRAIAARAEVLARDGHSERLKAVLAERGKLTWRDVVKALEEADQVAVDIIRDSGIAIGGVLAALVNFFNPSRIVIGGGVSQVGDVMLAAIRQKIYQHALPLTTRRLVVEHSSVGVNAGLIGAAVLALDLTLKGASGSSDWRGQRAHA